MTQRLMLFLTETRLHVWRSEGDQLAVAGEFPTDGGGEEGFRELVAAHPDAFYYLLTDLVEEDFKPDSIPHVNIRDHGKMVARKLEQVFRGTPYRTSQRQGRETEGRRNDRVLLSALSNAALLDKWLDILSAAEARLFGVYSVALLLAELSRKLLPATGSFLIVTQQHGGSLRQTYMSGGGLRFSRLASFGDASAEELAAAIATESQRARQFLASTRGIGRDEALQVIVLAAPADLPVLTASCPDGPLVQFRFEALPEVAARIGVQVEVADKGLVDVVLLKALLKQRVPNQYAPPDRRRYYQIWQRRWMLELGAAALLLAGLATAATFSSQSLSLQEAIGERDGRTAAAEAVYRENALVAAEGQATPEAMKNAVLAHRELVEDWPSLTRDTDHLSRVLEQFPAIQIDELEWGVRENADWQGDSPTGGSPPPGTEAPPATTGGVAPARFAVMIVKARIQTLGREWREALAMIDAFSAALKYRPDITIKSLALPIDLRPEGNLKLDSKEALPAGGAPFTVRMVLPLAPTAQTPPAEAAPGAPAG